jgi:hypothetical protein
MNFVVIFTVRDKNINTDQLCKEIENMNGLCLEVAMSKEALEYVELKFHL